jgi:hypothetical protein
VQPDLVANLDGAQLDPAGRDGSQSRDGKDIGDRHAKSGIG